MACIKDQKPIRFCEILYDSDHAKACRHSDKLAFQKAHEIRRPNIYTCHAGLTDVIIPIIFNDEYLGAVITGQTLTEESVPINTANLAKSFNVSKKDLDTALKNVPVVKMGDLEFHSHNLFAIINYTINIEIQKIEDIESQDIQFIEDKVHKAEMIIKEEYMKTELSMSEIARRVGVSRCYFSTSFKDMTGITFREYLNQVRIEKAKVLLQSTFTNITTIAYDLGYNDSNYFSTIFKKYVGLTPSDFRNQFVSDENN